MKWLIDDAEKRYAFIKKIYFFLNYIWNNSAQLLVNELKSSKSVLYKIILVGTVYLWCVSIIGFIGSIPNKMSPIICSFDSFRYSYYWDCWKNVEYSSNNEITDQEFINSIFSAIDSDSEGESKDQIDNFIGQLMEAFQIPSKQRPLIKNYEILIFRDEAKPISQGYYLRSSYEVFGKVFMNILQNEQDKYIVFDYSLIIDFEREHIQEIDKYVITSSNVRINPYAAYCQEGDLLIVDFKTKCP